jgi:hypothetical protein
MTIQRNLMKTILCWQHQKILTTTMKQEMVQNRKQRADLLLHLPDERQEQRQSG